MTVGDLENLEKSPPKISAKRKNLKVLNNRAMEQFGADAFSLDVHTAERVDGPLTDKQRRDEIQRRINDWSQMESLLSPVVGCP